MTTVELLLRGGAPPEPTSSAARRLAGDTALFAALAAEGEQRVGAQPAPTPPAACAPSAATSARAAADRVGPARGGDALANRLLARLEVEKIVTSARRGVEAKSVSRVAAADSLVALNLALSDGLASAGAPGAVASAAVDTPRSSMLAAKDQLSQQISAPHSVNTAARKAGVSTAAEAKAIAAAKAVVLAKAVVPAKAVAVATASAAPAKARRRPPRARPAPRRRRR